MDPLEALDHVVKDMIARLKPQAANIAPSIAGYARQRAEHVRANRHQVDINRIVATEAQNVKAWAVEKFVELADTADNAGWDILIGALGVAVRVA